MSKTVSRILKWGCLGISFASLLVAAVLMWSHQQANSELTETVGAKGDAGTNVEDPWMVERKGKRVLWRLKANDAQQGLTTMHFTRPYLELFNENNEKMTVVGDQADVTLSSRDVHFQGHVVVHFQTWVLMSKSLDVEHESGDVLVQQWFTANSPTATIKGRGLRIHHATRDMWIKHDVWMRQHDVNKP